MSALKLNDRSPGSPCSTNPSRLAMRRALLGETQSASSSARPSNAKCSVGPAEHFRLSSRTFRASTTANTHAERCALRADRLRADRLRASRREMHPRTHRTLLGLAIQTRSWLRVASNAERGNLRSLYDANGPSAGAQRAAHSRRSRREPPPNAKPISLSLGDLENLGDLGGLLGAAKGDDWAMTGAGDDRGDDWAMTGR
jgi:hypothetical protein